MHLVVVGGGVAGLGTALAGARAGHAVTVLERDATPIPPTADAAFWWDRRGAPQVRHSHAFLSRLRNLLVDRAPEVYAALLGAGATELRFTEHPPPTLTDHDARPGDERLRAIACRRTTFEWVLRRAVLAHAGVEFVDGIAIDGLVQARSVRNGGAPNGGIPRVAGVRGRHTADGRSFELTGDLVVDATGPRSLSRSWLAEIGVDEPVEQVVPSEIVYLSRFYRLCDACEAPPASGPIGGDVGYLKYAVFVGDNGTFSVTFAIDTDDRVMRRLTGVEYFERAAAQLVAAQPWLDGRSEPITGVHSMAGLRNRRRRFVHDDAPVVSGFAAVGDAHVCTNPLYGRGCSLAVVHAYGLVDALSLDDGDRETAFDEFTERELDPWFRASVQQDRESQAASHPDGPLDPQRDLMREVFRDGLLPAVRTSPAVYRAFLRWFNLEATPDALVSDPEVVAAVMQCYSERDQREPEAALGPDRATFLAALD